MKKNYYHVYACMLLVGQIVAAPPGKTLGQAAAKINPAGSTTKKPVQTKPTDGAKPIPQAVPPTTPIPSTIAPAKTTQTQPTSPSSQTITQPSTQPEEKKGASEAPPVNDSKQPVAQAQHNMIQEKFAPTIRILENAVAEYNAATKIFKSKENDIGIIRKCILDLLNLGMPINQPFVKRWDNGVVTPFDWAIVNGKPDFAFELLNLGANHSQPNAKNMTPLMFLYRPFGGSKSLDNNTRLKMANELISRGANTTINYAEPIFGNTALIYAVEAASVSGTMAADVEILLKAGAVINYENKRGISALDTAAFVADANVVDLLIKNGALVNKQGQATAQFHGQDDKTVTTLMYVALGAQSEPNPKKMEKQRNTFRILLCNGADIHLKDSNNNDISAYVAQISFLAQELNAYKADKDSYCAQHSVQ